MKQLTQLYTDFISENFVRKNESGKLNYKDTHKAIKKISPLIRKAGLPATAKTLGFILGVDAGEMDKIIKNGINKDRNGTFGQVLGAPQGRDPLYLLLVDLYRSGQLRDGMGVEKVAKRTGLSVDEIHDTVSSRMEEFQHEFDKLELPVKFNPSIWYGMKKNLNHTYDKDVASGMNSDQRLQHKRDLIYNTMKELTHNFSREHIRSIPGQTIADKTGISRPEIDKHLSDHSDKKMRELEPFRKVGKR